MKSSFVDLAVSAEDRVVQARIENFHVQGFRRTMTSGWDKRDWIAVLLPSRNHLMLRPVDDDHLHVASEARVYGMMDGEALRNCLRQRIKVAYLDEPILVGVPEAWGKPLHGLGPDLRSWQGALSPADFLDILNLPLESTLLFKLVFVAFASWEKIVYFRAISSRHPRPG